MTGTYLYLICHGKVTANVEPVISGLRATAGFSHGVAQAIARRDRLAATNGAR
ncbi:MAG: hypothetical protein LC769_07095 [Chloroflexi bacterium]|nr:hypothetical protein [Chloroflexota bacterium]